MIREFTKKLDFPTEAVYCLEQTYEKILSKKEVLDDIYNAMDSVFCDEEPLSFLEILNNAAEKAEINTYTFYLVFWIMCAKPLYYIYKAKELPEELYWESMMDLKYKMNDCKKRYDVWGVYSTWFKDYFLLNRFAFGRLQYDIGKWDSEEYKGFLKKGDLIFSCHIPSSGPLYPEAVIDSFKQVYSFYKDKLKDGILAIKCTSWLIYPPIAACCKESSNMRKFYDMFDIIDIIKRDKPYMGFWTIFGMDYEGPETLKKVPTDTSFRREMKQYFENGGDIGAGLGVILFDGEKIINK